MNIRKAIVFSLFLSAILFPMSALTKSTLAENKAAPVKVSIYPNNAKYPIKRLWEKLNLLITISRAKRVEKLISLTETRLAELDYLSENKTLDLIEASASRYSYYAGTLTQETQKARNGDLNLKVVGLLAEHGAALAKLRDRFPANSTYWLAIQQDIDSTKILSEKIK